MEHKKFYQKTWFMWALLIIFPLIGILYVWIAKREMSGFKKILLTCAGLFLGIIVLSSSGSSNDNTNTDNSAISERSIQVEDSESTTEVSTTEITSEISTSVVNTEEVTTESNNEDISPEKFVQDVKEVIIGSVGKNESIKDVTFENEDLCVHVDFSQVDPTPLTIEDLAFSRTSSITDEILNLTQYFALWKSITVDFGDIGYIRNYNQDIQKNEYGYYYFDSENFKLEGATTSNLNSEETTTEQETTEEMVWIPSSGSKYHSKSSCSGMKDPRQVPLSQAKNAGYTPCKRCH